jgi:type IV pilus secretin PilQ/predicted competence protein
MTQQRRLSTSHTARVPIAVTLALAGTIALAAVATPSVAPATTLEGVRAAHAAGRTTVTLTANGALTPSNITEMAGKPRRLVIDFADVSAQTASQDVSSPLVRKVRIGVNSRSPLVTRVTMEIDERATYHVERGPDAARDLEVIFEPGQDTTKIMLPPPVVPTEVVAPEAPITMEQALANGAPPLVEPATAKATPPAQQPAPAKPQPPAQPPAAPPTQTKAQPPAQPPAAPPVEPQAAPRPQLQQSTIRQPGDKKYIGHPVSLDFQDADLRSVLRALVAQGGLNVVFDNGVQGTIDIVLTDIPWDQALETILRANKLGYVAEGTIIRIAPLTVLAEEESDRRKLSEARALSGDLGVRTFSLSYARAQELQPLLTRSVLSPRGQIQVDQRTNTLIVTDLPDRLVTAQNLIMGLDRPEPQVEVEARIVQTTRDFARAIGIQWGLNGRMTPELGNTTGLAFPNRGTLGGRTGVETRPVDPRAGPLEMVGNAVNLPAANATSAIGLALGSINGAFNLDVALSALERSGKGRVLSTPRLTTQNNIQAKVQQGIQIPIQTIANNTVTVTFKEAVLMLQVTPQITAAGTVIMQVSVTNMAADFSREVNGIPPIDTQEAHTQVQVNDGATTVIGGIFVSREQASAERVPFLSRVPLIKWLFKADSVTDESRELLIFITPRILKS